MDALSWLPTAIAVVLFLGSAVIYLRGSRDKGTIDALERNNRALTERVGILESEQREDRAQIEGLVTANRVLTNTVNSAELIETLKTEVLAALLDHHNAALKGMATIHTDLADLPGRLAVAMRGKS